MRYTLGIWGFILLIASAVLIFAGMTMNTVVPSPSSELPAGLDGIANIQLMHVQLLYVMLGAVSGLASCCFFVGAAIVAVMQDAA